MPASDSGTDVRTDDSMIRSAEYDVAVIGAGPAGSVTAERIAAAGWRVVLLEKSEVPGKDSVCGGMIGQADADFFQIDPSLIEKRLFRTITYYPWGSLEICGPETMKNPLVMVQRKRFDRFLAERAVDSGAELRTQCRVTRTRRVVSGKMVLEVLDKNKKKEELEARLVVFADGPITLAQRCFGIGFEARPEQTAVSAICDFECSDNSMDYFESYYVPGIALWGFGWSFPFSEHLNLGLTFLRTEIRENRRLLLDRVEFMLERYLPSSRLVKERTMIHRRGALIPMGLARRIHDDSCLVVGDAAGFVGAFTGVGITYAMHSGTVAAEVAIEALDRKDFSAKFLSLYPRRWRRSKKYRKLLIMEYLKKIFLWIHRVDSQFLNKIKYVFNVMAYPAQGRRLRFVELVRVVFYPLLGNPEVKTVHRIKPGKAASGSMVGKGG